MDTVAAKQENFAHSLMKEVSLAMSDFVKEREVVRKKVFNRSGEERRHQKTASEAKVLMFF